MNRMPPNPYDTYSYPCDEASKHTCDVCWYRINTGELFYSFDGIDICDDCIEGYMKRNFQVEAEAMTELDSFDI